VKLGSDPAACLIEMRAGVLETAARDHEKRAAPTEKAIADPWPML
jgi:hypothetical protein